MRFGAALDRPGIVGGQLQGAVEIGDGRRQVTVTL